MWFTFNISTVTFSHTIQGHRQLSLVLPLSARLRWTSPTLPTGEKGLIRVEKLGLHYFLVPSPHPCSLSPPLLYLLANSSPWTFPLHLWLHSSSPVDLQPPPPQYLWKSQSSAFPSLTHVHLLPLLGRNYTSNTRYTAFHISTWALHVTLIP